VHTQLGLVTHYHFGGYGKVDEALIPFISEFLNEKQSIPSDPVYTGKMMFGLVDLIQNDILKPNTKNISHPPPPPPPPPPTPPPPPPPHPPPPPPPPCVVCVFILGGFTVVFWAMNLKLEKTNYPY